nr:vegetative cell wall protein gp1-like [Vulpes vulpes]
MKGGQLPGGWWPQVLLLWGREWEQLLPMGPSLPGQPLSHQPSPCPPPSYSLPRPLSVVTSHHSRLLWTNQAGSSLPPTSPRDSKRHCPHSSPSANSSRGLCTSSPSPRWKSTETAPHPLCPHPLFTFSDLPPGLRGGTSPSLHLKARPGGSCQCPPGVRDPGPVAPTSFLPGCCYQWCHDPAALQAHGPCRLPPQVCWQRAYHSHRGGVSGCRRGPQPPILQQQQQPQPPPPNPLRQRLCSVSGARKGPPATAAVPMQPAAAPEPPPKPTISPTAAPAMASSGPGLASAARALLEPGRPSAARPLPAPAACGSFTYSSGAHPAFLRALSLLRPPSGAPGPSACPPPRSPGPCLGGGCP